MQGFVAPFLYEVSRRRADAFRDIVKGNNGMGTKGGFSAAPGWDPVTGLGTPNFKALLDEALMLP